ncbi:hypothetical protein MKW94_007624 [Papaver nudicaule]|uniref:Uncharacterized protein n=1 Tax=Papaver nudicaule TaxID=74823 RepID=A0AA41VNL8_PAPNU|nr:hypothetical protein [Papaver nudicaule]
MNSIFSSFDAACFEFLHQKLSYLPPCMEMKNNNNTGGDNKVSSSTPEVKQVQKKKQEEKKKTTTTTRRYALELDGLNCFETIV